MTVRSDYMRRKGRAILEERGTPLRTRVRKTRTAKPETAKKAMARKSQALIVAEGEIKALKDDVAEIKGWQRWMLVTSFSTLLAALGALLHPYLAR